MDDITITLKAPITEHCRKCDYEESRSLYSHRVRCPECGANISRGERMPEHMPITVYRNLGQYSLGSTEESYCYTFHNLPCGSRKSFVVDEDLDTEDPIDLICELHDIYSRYFSTSRLKDIEQLKDTYDTDEHREQQEKLRSEHRVRVAKLELYTALHEAKSFEE